MTEPMQTANKLFKLLYQTELARQDLEIFAEECGDDLEEAFDSLSEQAQEGEKGQRLQATLELCRQFTELANNLFETVNDAVESPKEFEPEEDWEFSDIVAA